MEQSNLKNNVVLKNEPHHSVKVRVDPFYSKENLQYIRDGIAALDAGLGVEHDIKDA
jgi:hypothetical protein